MRRLRALSDIQVPKPKKDQIYRFSRREGALKEVSFKGLKTLLGAADMNKAGDRHAGLSAPTETAREQARAILAGLTLEHLYDNPLVDDRGRVDEVMRVNYDIDLEKFKAISHMTLGQLKDHLLKASGDEIKRLGAALTGVMAAALTKLMDVHELIFVARKIERKTKARTELGQRGVLAARLQPNHPTDDLRGLTLLTYAGLSLGSGDALIGVNPAIDTVENVSSILKHMNEVRRQTGAPTQICVLAHIKTQMASLEQGAPVEIMFQSLAGTESTLLTEFDVSVDLLDRAYTLMQERGPLASEARQFMYFETGQGSEYTYGKHNGMDMTTTEALCYGLARRYDPFMVNNVTGFIGPETHLDSFEMMVASLQDHFMGKLLGVPMGVAPCFTLHSKILLEGQQIATELLASAGANFYMDVCLNTDRMLAYFDTSAHDNQTLREIHNKRPTPAFEKWAIEQGIFSKNAEGDLGRGPNWGNARRFCSSEMEYQELCQATPAFQKFEHAGPRPTEEVSRQMRLNQAISRDAINSELELVKLSPKKRGVTRKFRIIETEAKTKEAHLNSPNLGTELNSRSVKNLKAQNKQIQVIVSDGLSAEAVHCNVPQILDVLEDGFLAHKIKVGQPILARYGRVKLGEKVADKLRTDLTIMLIGERPGGDADSARSLSAYFIYRIADPRVRQAAAKFSGNSGIRFEYSVVSNIYSPGGLPPTEAGGVIVEKALEILRHQAAGNRLEAILKSKNKKGLSQSLNS